MIAFLWSYLKLELFLVNKVFTDTKEDLKIYHLTWLDLSLDLAIDKYSSPVGQDLKICQLPGQDMRK